MAEKVAMPPPAAVIRVAPPPADRYGADEDV
ncbi:hypothetical protein SAMN05878503_13213 [Cereibacter ovatus]|uniref:Uncharacterized protein n=1 Tax=Cereibacter ovatus TaxID=439529 RepID=A0A285D5Y4_9RHOB|nr:hypothetical protein SAMN05878503_13213 [Cereibacter ovatus]